MDFTTSYEGAFTEGVLGRYKWLETRNAATVLRATNPAEFIDLEDALAEFELLPEFDIHTPGGNESETAGRLNALFRTRGWREGSYKVSLAATLALLPWAQVGETQSVVAETESASTSYLIDNIKGRVALDVEWHAKDGNLDRDISAYRTLYDAGIIDGAVIVTMVRKEMVAWARELLGAQSKKFGTSTTTNLEKLVPRLQRGDAGGCPVLVAAVCRATT